MPSGSAKPPMICVHLRRGPMRAAWLGSSPRRTSKTGRIDARGKITCRPRLSIVLKRPSYRRESELAPRDFPPFEKPDFEALGSRLDGLVQQAGTIDQLHLADPRNVVIASSPSISIRARASSHASRSAPALADSLSSR